MIVKQIDQDSESWLQERRGKITGSKLKDLYSPRGDRKDGFYQLLADRLALVDESGDGSDRDRGHEKEVEALEMFQSEYINLVNPLLDIAPEIDTKPGMWVADFNENIAISPDGAIKSKNDINDEGKYYEAIEIKCLAAKNHLRAVIENKIPREFHYQVIQYFLVCETLEVLHFVFYDDRITARPFHMIDVTREEVADEVERMKRWEIETLEEVEKLALELNGF